MRVAVVDYGVGSPRGVSLGIARAGGEVVIAQRASDLVGVDAIVLPGVGAFRDAVERLRFMEEAVKRSVEEGKPLLGICLGLQVLFNESTEGGLVKGLGYIKGRVVRLPANVKVPHMGWNTVHRVRGSELLEGLEDGCYMYFTHSHYASPEEDVAAAVTHYGVEFPSVIEKPPLYATQFHPEKSGAAGLAVLRNFLSLARR